MATANVEIIVYRRYSDAAARPSWHGCWLLNGHYIGARAYGRTAAAALSAAQAELRRYGVDEGSARVDEGWWRRQT